MKFALTALIALTTVGLTAKASSSVTYAFNGTYSLSQPCDFTVSMIGAVHIPAGSIRVTENIPISDDRAGIIPGILFQANDELKPALQLGVGVIAPFEYGGSPFSNGKYENSGSRFLEEYSSDQAPAHGVIDGSIRLSKSGSVLTLTSGNSICLFQ